MEDFKLNVSKQVNKISLKFFDGRPTRRRLKEKDYGTIEAQKKRDVLNHWIGDSQENVRGLEEEDIISSLQEGCCLSLLYKMKLLDYDQYQTAKDYIQLANHAFYSKSLRRCVQSSFKEERFKGGPRLAQENLDFNFYENKWVEKKWNETAAFLSRNFHEGQSYQQILDAVLFYYSINNFNFNKKKLLIDARKAAYVLSRLFIYWKR